jgi:hypothetical protein
MREQAPVFGYAGFDFANRGMTWIASDEFL